MQPHQNGDRKDDPKRPRACEACRGLKVRCEPDPAKGTCKRCAKAGRQCVVTVPSRKRQKKTDSRVAELEKKIDALTASLQATKNHVGSDSDGDSSAEDYQNEPDNDNHSDPRVPGSNDSQWLQQPSPLSNKSMTAFRRERKRKRSGYPDEDVSYDTQTMSAHSRNGHRLKTSAIGSDYAYQQPAYAMKPLFGPVIDPSLPGHDFSDVIDRKVLDSEMAARIFDHYTRNMAPQMPVVVFPPGTKYGDIRKTKSTLFLAILSVASGHEYPDIQGTLMREITRVYADSIIGKGHKSVELIQALQVSTVWYSAEELKDGKSYQLIHMAASLAIALGLGRRQSMGPAVSLWSQGQNPRNTAAELRTTECRRAWLSCYLLTGW